MSVFVILKAKLLPPVSPTEVQGTLTNRVDDPQLANVSLANVLSKIIEETLLQLLDESEPLPELSANFDVRGKNHKQLP